MSARHEHVKRDKQTRKPNVKNCTITLFLYVTGKEKQAWKTTKRYGRKPDDKGVFLPNLPTIKPTNPDNPWSHGFYTMPLAVALAYGLAPGQG